MAQSLKIGAFVVAFRDEAAVNRIVHSLLVQTRKIDSILIIDNSPNPIQLKISGNIENSRIEKSNYTDNIGISGALNVAKNWAIRNGFDWLWMFDQDSEPNSSALEKLLQSAEKLEIDAHSPGILACGVHAPSGEFLATGYDWCDYKYVETPIGSTTGLYRCDAVISSGSLINVERLKQARPVEQKLFIDLVDFDLCRKLVAEGFHIYLVPEAKMTHVLGEPVLVKIPFRREVVTYFHLSPVRVFHICRNQSFIEFSNSKIKYWPLVFFNRLKHCFYFVQGGLFSSPRKYKIIAAATIGLFFGFFSPKFWTKNYFRN